MQMATADDLAAVKAWFETLAGHVREVDFIGARPIFAPDMVAFGTFTDFMTGRDAAEQQQWRIVSPDRLQAVGMAIFDSTGYRQDGTPYDRPGRATIVFARARVGDAWLAQH